MLCGLYFPFAAFRLNEMNRLHTVLSACCWLPACICVCHTIPQVSPDNKLLAASLLDHTIKVYYIDR